MLMPRVRYHYYDPDPFPIWIVVAGLVSLILWTQPNLLNNLIYLFNPELRKLEEERQKTTQETVRALILITLLICGVIILMKYWERKRK
jgi:hypothetical protein